MMAAKQVLLRAARTASSGAALSPAFTRSFQTSTRLLSEAAPLPARKPVGAFRGGLFGFLLGTTLSGSAVYYYVLQEFKESNNQLTDDIVTLQRTTQALSNHLTLLEDKVQTDRKK